jgi:hypothetical protein
MTDEVQYRVLADPHEPDRWLLVDTETAEVAAVPTGEAPALAPGNRVRARLDWTTDPPALDELAVETATRFRFARTDEPLFEAARECWDAARSAGEAMNAAVTRDTDNEDAGVVYTFADTTHDLFAEFADGSRPLDPLLSRVERVAPPYEVFVLDPQGDPFVVVYVVLDPDGLLAETVRDTYC